MLVFWGVMLLFPMFRRHLVFFEGHALQDPGSMKALCVISGFCREVAENSALLSYYAASRDGKKLSLLAA